MTLSQVAGDDLSRQAVHQIEVGRSRPSPRALELIAERTGKPLSFFLAAGPAAPDSAFAHDLQWLCLEKRYPQAVAEAERLLGSRLPGRLEAEVRYWLGQALVHLDRPEEAIEQLVGARALAESAADPWLVVECLDWEAGARYLKEDPQALAVAEEALAACRRLEPPLPRTEARILEHLGSIHVRQHQLDEAVACYEAAVEAAGAVRDLARVARTYHGLSIAYRERGLLERAAGFAHKALSLYALEHDHALVARAENELGLLHLRQGRLDQAEQLFLSALAHLRQTGAERGQSHVLLSLAELHLVRGELEPAERFLAQGQQLASRLEESLAVATGRLLRARLLAARASWGEADAEFAAAEDLLRDLGLKERLAVAHAEHARSYEVRGEHEEAAREWRLAAELAMPALTDSATAKLA